MTYAQAQAKLEKVGQGQVLAFWKKLDKAARTALLAQVDAIDEKDLARCKAALAQGSAAVDNSKGLAPKVAELKGKALADFIARSTELLK